MLGLSGQKGEIGNYFRHIGQVPGASAIGAGVGVGLQVANIKDALPDAIGAASSFYHGDIAQGVEHLAGLTDNLTIPGGRSAFAKPQTGAPSTLGIHGNARSSPRPATLYRLQDAEGNLLKHGVTQDTAKRYTKKFMADKRIVPVNTGTRADMLDLERQLVMRNPGPLNHERWAGLLEP